MAFIDKNGKPLGNKLHRRVYPTVSLNDPKEPRPIRDVIRAICNSIPDTYPGKFKFEREVIAFLRDIHYNPPEVVYLKLGEILNCHFPTDDDDDFENAPEWKKNIVRIFNNIVDYKYFLF
jgi:hypothetical protein